MRQVLNVLILLVYVCSCQGGLASPYGLAFDTVYAGEMHPFNGNPEGHAVGSCTMVLDKGFHPKQVVLDLVEVSSEIWSVDKVDGSIVSIVYDFIEEKSWCLFRRDLMTGKLKEKRKLALTVSHSLLHFDPPIVDPSDRSIVLAAKGYPFGNVSKTDENGNVLFTLPKVVNDGFVITETSSIIYVLPTDMGDQDKPGVVRAVDRNGELIWERQVAANPYRVYLLDDTEKAVLVLHQYCKDESEYACTLSGLTRLRKSDGAILSSISQKIDPIVKRCAVGRTQSLVCASAASVNNHVAQISIHDMKVQWVHELYYTMDKNPSILPDQSVLTWPGGNYKDVVLFRIASNGTILTRVDLSPANSVFGIPLVGSDYSLYIAVEDVVNALYKVDINGKVIWTLNEDENIMYDTMKLFKDQSIQAFLQHPGISPKPRKPVRFVEKCFVSLLEEK